MNTRRRALSDGCSALSSARAAATSGRSCSAACRVFFEGDVVTLIESPDLCASSGERLWPVPGFAATLPVLVHRSSQRIAVEAPISNRRAVSRLLSPASTIPTTRARRSFEYPFAIVPPPSLTKAHESDLRVRGKPRVHYDSHQTGTALAHTSADNVRPECLVCFTARGTAVSY